MSGVAQNSVTLQDGIIIVRQVGDQTYDSISQITEDVRLLAKNLPEMRILVDHHETGKLDIGARKAGFSVGRDLPFDKMAFYGTSPYMTGLINLLARTVGKRDRIYFAPSAAKALAWLKK